MQLTAEEDDIFKWAFGLLNTAEDGTVESRELQNFMVAIGRTVTDSEIFAMINESDLDGNGVIEYNEFVAIVSQRMRGNLDDDELRDAFRVYDKENSGYITIGQVRRVLIDLDSVPVDDDLDEVFHLYDNDNDGKLSYEEFALSMSKK